MASDYDDDITFTEYTLGQEQLEKIEEILIEDLINSGVHSVLLIDMAGNIIAKADNGACEHDVYSLAALASANFAAVDTMAKIVGEDEFSLLFHKGETESIHFSKVQSEFLLISIFGKKVSLGLLRLKVAEAIEKIKDVWKQ
ncbi:Roadblock/LC7 domain-containing protein [Desulfonema limicola]|uniref:Roadblock/LC7 domain-containing protein n=1 Tax=Desulfonema limicola TaxID=45656 RepID=A0A975GGE2_9BACT|nr:roadblock/LC7 domain-containing protein [Desulfonema limicola]QTA80158.1 Roadblock/LC7 domain-containing protein [Desulfonema limicola]